MLINKIKSLFIKKSSWERLDELMFKMASPNDLTEYVRLTINNPQWKVKE